MAHLLALTVGLGGFVLYMAAFFYPEVHRRFDFLWSGVAMLYGLVLWFCAGRISGALMLGQMASVSLILWLGWQTLTLRRSRTPAELQTPASASDVQQQAQQAFSQLQQGSLSKTLRSAWSTVQDTLQKGIAAATSVSQSSRITKPRHADYEYTDDSAGRSPAHSAIAQASQSASPPATPDSPRTPRPPKPSAASTAANPFLRSSQTSRSTPSSSSAPADSADAQSSPKPARLPASPSKLTLLKDWLTELLSRKPKAKPPMIELPPRPPSIPRPPKAKTATSNPQPSPAQPPTDIIDAEIIDSED
ncbi:Ycf66 family protein [Sphaerothrix gracilis]|uniref:Ycf66 family protein n=1 Tax=Sphaerothrix gracilis TaxID=3151835 RepID=UPI0031FE0DDB